MPRCRSFILTSLVAASCISSSLHDPKIEYHIAVIEDDVIGVASNECRVEDGNAFTYRYPSGLTVAIEAAKQSVLTIALDESVEVRLLDYRAAKSPEMQAVIAHVIPGEDVRGRALEVRRSFFRCDLLVTVNGRVVGIERRGTNWRDHLPGGTFASTEDAERTFSVSEASVQRESPDQVELQKQDDFWQWRRKKDIWDFHCDGELRHIIKAKDRELYEALSKTPPVDCKAPPLLPAPATAD
jgi:hypothetical protein